MNSSLRSTILWTLLAGLMGATLFFIKHEVKDLETRLALVNRDIVRNQEDIHVLKAEWSYLNDPVRLRQLAERYLGMKQMGPTQIATLDTLNSTWQAPTALAQAHPKTIAPAPAPVAVAAVIPPKAAAPKSVAPTALASAAPVPQHTTMPTPAAPRHRVAGGTGLAMATPLAGEAR